MIRPNEIVMIDENRFYITNIISIREGLANLLKNMQV